MAGKKLTSETWAFWQIRAFSLSTTRLARMHSSLRDSMHLILKQDLWFWIVCKACKRRDAHGLHLWLGQVEEKQKGQSNGALLPWSSQMGVQLRSLRNPPPSQQRSPKPWSRFRTGHFHFEDGDQNKIQKGNLIKSVSGSVKGRSWSTHRNVPKAA